MGEEVALPSARYINLIQPAQEYDEALSHGAKIDYFDPRMPPGMWAALRGLWRGNNKYDNEQIISAQDRTNKSKTVVDNPATRQG